MAIFWKYLLELFYFSVLMLVSKGRKSILLNSFFTFYPKLSSVTSDLLVGKFRLILYLYQ